jgi:hypothetical protein
MAKRRDSLPAPRADGRCVDCEKEIAVTRDDRFCLRCLRKRIDDTTPAPVHSVFEQRGRKSRDTKVLGGQAEMNTDGDNW